MRLPFFSGGAYVSRSPLVDPEDSVNFFCERPERPGAKNDVVLYPPPGFTSVFTQATNNLTSYPLAGSVRGLIAVDAPAVFPTAGYPLDSNTLFFVAGGGLYQYPNPSSPPALASYPLDVTSFSFPAFQMPVDSHPVRMAWSGVGGVELIIATAGAVYRYDPTIAAFSATPVLASSFGIVSVGLLDSFFLALDSATTLRISESFDATTWNPTQIVQRTARADPWVSMVVTHGDIWLFGTRTTDVYFNAGTAPFPFQQRDFLEQGTDAPYSVAVLDNAPIWLGRSSSGAGMVFRAQGYVPQRVSDFALEAALARYTTTIDAEGDAFMVDGHWFYALTFPTENVSWLYDASNGLWTRVGYWNASRMRYDAYRLRGHAYVGGTHYVGDRGSAAVFSASTAVSTDFDGNGIRRMRRTPILSSEGVRLFFRTLQIDLEVGLGLTSGQGSDPQLMVRWSDDGGKTWSNEHLMRAGAIGRYGTRAILDRLGSGRKRVFEVSCSDPIPWRLIDAFIDIEQGTH